MSDEAHWMNDSKVRAGFWAYAKGDLGLTEDEVHQELQCESVLGYAGTKEQAVKILKAYTARKLYEWAKTMPEAPTTTWTKFMSPLGFEWSYSIRGGLPPCFQALAMDQARDAVRDFEAMAKAEGWLIPGALNGAPARKLVAADGPDPVGPHGDPGTPPTAPQPEQSGNGGGSETFLAESVTAQVSPKGNRYYAIRGGRCKLHGVKAWPEIAEPQLEKLTGYDPIQLKVGKEWDITEFNIQAVGVIPEGKKYPNKVTAFAPMQ